MGRTILAGTVAILTLAALAGCANLARPDWSHPGTMRSQQLRAQQIDPYPDVDLGPVPVGARPRDFDQPPAETVKAQWNTRGPGGRMPF